MKGFLDTKIKYMDQGYQTDSKDNSVLNVIVNYCTLRGLDGRGIFRPY